MNKVIDEIPRSTGYSVVKRCRILDRSKKLYDIFLKSRENLGEKYIFHYSYIGRYKTYYDPLLGFPKYIRVDI